MPIYPQFPYHTRDIAWLLEETAKNNGLAPIDNERFWADQEISRVDPFDTNISQMPLGIMMSGECVYDELGNTEDYWRYDNDERWRLELNKAYNDKSEPIVGYRLLNEEPLDTIKQWPAVKGIVDLFEAENIWIPGTWSWWLQESAHSESELEALLDRVNTRLDGDLRSFILPDNWDEEKSRLAALRIPPPRLRGLRGPVTFATSIYGVERLIYLFSDNEPLLLRFRDTILRAFLAVAHLLNAEAGDTPETIPHGFWIADDNCYLMTPAMYESFGYPILKGFFDHFSPDPGDLRFQHSDSAMGHLLPILASLWLTEVNLSKEHRGVVFSTAGSLNNGSRLTGMRLIMSAIQHFGRYT